MSFTAPSTGRFSANPNQVINQDWFDATFAGRLHTDPLYRKAYNCNVIGQCTMSTWFEEYMGYETECHTKWSLIENAPAENRVIVKTSATIAPYPAVTNVALSANSHYVGGVYVLPQSGNSVVLKNGQLADVITVNPSTPNNTTIGVRLRDHLAVAQTVVAGSSLMVLSGSILEDCQCPEGNFSFEDLPIIHDISMIAFGDRAELCGEALTACQFLKIPFEMEDGTTAEKWFTPSLQEMYRRFEERKHYERMFNPVFGLIPVLKARGLNFATASNTAITIDDIKQWKKDLVAAGITQTEFAIFAGVDAYLQWQDLLGQTGVANLNYRELTDECAWINMQYCGISVAGLNLHIYEDCSFSNGKALGGAGSAFPNASIIVPLWERQQNQRGADDNRMLTTVFFKDQLGRTWDRLTDSNGIYGIRNTFGAGCDQQEWTIKTMFTQEVHCPNQWGFSRLP